MDTGGYAGGISKLRELIKEHEPAIAYDFRHRFGVSIETIGFGMSYREAIMLTSVLRQDPSSWLQASMNEWKSPASPEWMLLARLVDVQTMSKSKNKVDPIPRPWPNTYSHKIGADNKRSQDEIRSILDAMKPKENDGE